VRNPVTAGDRAAFLALLRFFPLIEMQWHAGLIPEGVATAAIADLAGLARALCFNQAVTGEPFLAPLRNCLDKCEEYRALYLTGSEARPRGDWLLDEVLRLMNEAESLMQSGRPIEANAVAALAEWRARALEFAARAPAERALAIASLDSAPEEDAEAVSEESPASETEAPAPDEAAPAETEPEQEPEPEERPEPQTEPEQAPDRIVHTVKRGDNPSVIAAQYGVAVDDLLKWNNLSRRSVLSIGDELVVYRGEGARTEPAAAPAKPEPRKVVHTVKRGDNPSVIANKYNVALDDFLKWNNLNRRSTLHIGEEYVVYLPAE
jgi:LysM repeat protein